MHSPSGNGAIPPPALFRPLSSQSCRARLILRPVMVGRLQSISSPPLSLKPFAGQTSKLQGYSDLGKWEAKMRYAVSKDVEKEEEEAEQGGGHHHGFFFMCRS